MTHQTAVKAVIYDDCGRVLLQHRDNIPGIGEPNRWGFFGGKAEKGESFREALSRELSEELGCEIGPVEKEIFRLSWNSSGVLNVVFQVRCTESENNIRLSEGQSFGWFPIDEIVVLPLSALVFRHMSFLLRIVADIDKDSEARLERALLDHCRLNRHNDEVFYVRELPTVLDMQSILLMKELATYRELPIFRVCLHTTADEPIHEMLMVHTRPLTIGPLKQNKLLSYHMLDGVADIHLHDDSGVCNLEMHLDSNDDFCDRSVRLKANVFRSVQSLSPYAIFLEVAVPFKYEDTTWLTRGLNHEPRIIVTEDKGTA